MYKHAKNQFIPSVNSSVTVNFRILSSDQPHPFLTMPAPKIFIQFLICVPACKKSVNSITSFLRYVNFRVKTSDWPHPFLTMPNKNIFDQLFIFVNLYQNAKNEAVSLICSVVMVNLLREHFNLYLRNTSLPKQRICAGTQQII